MAPFALQTARLRLRELESSDLEFVAEMLGDAEVMRFYPKPLSRDESLAWIERQRTRYLRDGHGLWLVSELESGAPVGQVGLVMQEVAGLPRARYPEVGYLLHRPYWGRGYATEAASAVRDFAFHDRGEDDVISLIRPVNAPSRAVADRLGMTVRGETMQCDLPHLVYGVCRAASGALDT